MAIATQISVGYRENTVQYMKEYMRVYNAERVECPCGKNYARGKKHNHLRTRFHQKNTM